MPGYDGYSYFSPPRAVHFVSGQWNEFFQFYGVSCSRCGPLGSFTYEESEPPLDDPDGCPPSERLNLDHEDYFNARDGVYPCPSLIIQPEYRRFEPEISYLLQNDIDEELILMLRFLDLCAGLSYEPPNQIIMP
jgi:hypothetical protein